MSALTTLQRDFMGVLMDEADRGALEGAVRGDARADAATRVAIYADMYRLRLLDVLAEVYPRTRTQLGDGFEALATDYIRAHPSRSPSLRSFGDRFAAFLAARDVAGAAASLALLEWTRYEVFDAVDEPVLRRERLAALTPEEVASFPLRSLRACRLIRCDHDVDALYRALADEDDGARLATSGAPTHVLVWRETPTVFHRRVEARETRLLEQIVEGASLGHLCETLATDQAIDAAAAEAFALVGRWIADGILVDPG